MFNEGKAKIGLGTAISKLINIRFQRTRGYGDSNEQNDAENALLIEALNQYELHISFVCEEDEQGVNESIDIIKKSATTKVKRGVSCCRIKPKDLSSEEMEIEKEQLAKDLGMEAKPKPKRKRKSTSRRKK